MSDYTPTAAPYINPALPTMIRGLYRADLREKSIQNMLDLAADLVQELIELRAKRAEWEAEQGEGEHVFIERYGAHHAKFGGIGGDATSLTITREAWKSVGEPDVLAVSWVPVEQEGESR